LSSKESNENHGWLGRFFKPRFDFYSLLASQAATTLKGMEALELWIAEGAEGRCQTVRDLEHEADRQKLELQKCLVESLITPFDREDIYDLSARLDEVINAAKSTVKEMEALEMTGENLAIAKMSKNLVNGTRHLSRSFALLGSNFQESTSEAALARKSESKFERIYRKSMQELFVQNDAKMILRTIEVYKAMNNASHCIDVVGEKIIHVLVKMS